LGSVSDFIYESKVYNRLLKQYKSPENTFGFQRNVGIAGKEHSSQSMDTTIEKKKKRFYRFQIPEIT
jgi:hypothetical protein